LYSAAYIFIFDSKVTTWILPAFAAYGSFFSDNISVKVGILFVFFYLMNKMYIGKGRASNRLLGYDYRTKGWYFVTICTDSHQEIFGIIKNECVDFTQMGDIAYQCWIDIPLHFNHVRIDEYVIMPNHVHGILHIYKNIRRCDDWNMDTACRVHT